MGKTRDPFKKIGDTKGKLVYQGKSEEELKSLLMKVNEES